MSEMEKGQVLVSAEHLVKTYRGRTVVKDVSISVRSGEVVGLLGPNGAGKTTSFYMVMGLIRPDGGSVSFRGVDVTHIPMYKRARMGMGYLAQEPSIFRKLTVEENIMAILETLDISRAERKKRCAELLEELGLTRLKDQKAMTLSGGERRRLEITRALVTNPSLILADEPTGNLDSTTSQEIMDIFHELHAQGNTIVLITHDNEIARQAERSIHILDGRITEVTL